MLRNYISCRCQSRSMINSTKRNSTTNNVPNPSYRRKISGIAKHLKQDFVDYLENYTHLSLYYNSQALKREEILDKAVAWYKWKCQACKYQADQRQRYQELLEWLKRELNETNNHACTMCNLVQQLYPDRECHPWLQGVSRRSFWRVGYNQKHFLDWLANKLHISEPHLWYSVERKKIIENGGIGLLQYHNNSLYDALVTAYPEHSWQPWRFRIMPSDYWHRVANQRQFLEWMQTQLKSKDAWYRVNKDFIHDNGGQIILNLCNNSVWRMLETVLPEGQWQPWRFANVSPEEYCREMKYCRQFFDFVAHTLQLKDTESWYGVSAKEVERLGGKAFLIEYGGSVAKALQATYPEVPWQPWRFSHLPKQFWEDKNVQKMFLEYLGLQLGYKELEDWYNITREDFIRFGGGGFLTHTNNSLYAALSSVYPDHSWQPWRFGSLPKKFWEKVENQKQFLDWIASLYGITSPVGWVKVNHYDIINHGGHALLQLYGGSLQLALMQIFPSIQYGSKRKNFDELAELLELARVDDWYRVTQEALEQIGGTHVLEVFENLTEALKHVYPSTNWHPWKFGDTRWCATCWEDLNFSKELLETIALEMNMASMESWYSVTKQDIVDHGGGALLRFFGDSPSTMLQEVYTEYSWKAWKFHHIRRGYWDSWENQREFMESLKKECNINCDDDWYKISKHNIINHGGLSLLLKYDDSLHTALENIFPEIEWQPWRFEGVRHSYWEDEVNHSRFFEFTAKKLGITACEQWCTVSLEDITHCGGQLLLENYYDNSLPQALLAIYPECDWPIWKFPNPPKGCWGEVVHQRRFFEYLGKQLGLSQITDWYRVTRETIVAYGGKPVLLHYQHSYVDALMKLFPDLNLEPWKFQKAPKYFWNDVQNHKHVLNCVEKMLNISRPEDWYGITQKHVLAQKGHHLLERYNSSILELLKTHYPTQHWDLGLWTRRVNSKAEMFLYQCLGRLLPTLEIVHTYKLPFKYPNGREMWLDVWIPSCNLAVEYQGNQHFEEDSYWMGDDPLYTQCVKDNLKAIACIQSGIQLVSIPHWWDCTMDTLASTLQQCTT